MRSDCLTLFSMWHGKVCVIVTKRWDVEKVELKVWHRAWTVDFIVFFIQWMSNAVSSQWCALCCFLPMGSWCPFCSYQHTRLVSGRVSGAFVFSHIFVHWSSGVVVLCCLILYSSLGQTPGHPLHHFHHFHFYPKAPGCKAHTVGIYVTD